MKNPQAPEGNLDFVVTCVACKQELWDMKILMHDGKKVFASEWKSRHPELYPHKAPSNFECPICHKPFGRKRAERNGVAEYDMRVIHGDAIRWI